MFLSYFTLAVALCLSITAAWYSIIGLTAIFAAAAIPIIIMGGILEVAKVTITVWLHEYWDRCRLAMKIYLVPAVGMLMLITSMGIFGFLSKAHSDQSLVSGETMSKIAIYDEKIKTEKENIDANRRVLKQMDEGVDQVLGRSTTEAGAEKAVAMRKTQQKERARLQAEILQSQKSIAELSDARAPIASEVRKVEAEVGPIKYIAALIYGDNPDTNVLERAVRWVIILLVIVFDPLAIMMVLAATESLKWRREDRKQIKPEPEPTVTEPAYEPDDGPINQEVLEQLRKRAKEELPVSDPTIKCYKCGTELMNAPGIGLYCPNKACDVVDDINGSEITWKYITPEPVNVEPEKSLLEQHPYLLKGFDHFEGLKPLVYNPPQTTEEDTEDGTEEEKQAQREWKRQNPGATVKSQRTLLEQGRIEQLPWLGLIADNDTGFGPEFPPQAKKGDTWVKTDSLPTCLFKFNGSRWIDIDKATTDSYTYNTAYIDHLINKISSGEYDPDLLSDAEREQVEQRLQTKT